MENSIEKMKELAGNVQALEDEKCFIIIEDNDGHGTTRIIGGTGWVFENLIRVGQADDNMAAAIKGAAAAL